jgi:hypothetical protein
MALGAPYTGVISGLPDPSLIESFTVIFDVTNDFAIAAGSFQRGSAVPFVADTNPNLLPWDASNQRGSAVPFVADTNPNLLPWDASNSTGTGTFTVELSNGDLFDPFLPPAFQKDGVYSENNLLNGELFRFEILEGSITGIQYFLAADSTGIAVPYDYEVDFRIVPIPSTILLLGGGLIGLVALRRKRS